MSRHLHIHAAGPAVSHIRPLLMRGGREGFYMSLFLTTGPHSHRCHRSLVIFTALLFSGFHPKRRQAIRHER